MRTTLAAHRDALILSKGRDLTLRSFVISLLARDDAARRRERVPLFDLN